MLRAGLVFGARTLSRSAASGIAQVRLAREPYDNRVLVCDGPCAPVRRWNWIAVLLFRKAL